MGGALGYGPRPGVRVVSRKTVGNQLIYDVDYTISDRRVRVTRGNPNGDTWLFMGCSLMFGEGVNDDETLPAYFSADLGYQANVVNLGFHGYGPHQMLRSLELDLPVLLSMEQSDKSFTRAFGPTRGARQATSCGIPMVHRMH